MPGPQPLALTLSEKQRTLLAPLSRRQISPHRLVRRASLIVAAAEGGGNDAIARWLSPCRDTVRRWRQRWQAGTEALEAHIDAPGFPPAVGSLAIVLIVLPLSYLAHAK